jgi:small-conductance mechanosensitive channel
VEGKTDNELAREYAERMRQAIAAYQQEHSLTNLLSGIIKTLLALLALVVLIMLVNRAVRRLNQAILAPERIRAVKIGEFEFFTADRIKKILVKAVKTARFLIILIFIYTYFHLGLSFFPWTKKYALQLFDSIQGAISAIGEAIWDQTPALVFLAILFLITRYVLKTLRYFFDQVSAGKVTVVGLDAEVAPMTYKLLRLLIIAFVAVVAYPYVPGSHSPAFKGISIFLGVLFSLGSTSAVANLIAGVNLTYQRSFHLGDMIKIGEVMAMVVERKL